MNINYGILKIKNHFGLAVYDKELTDLIDKYFGNEDDLNKQVEIQNILYRLETSNNLYQDYTRILNMLRTDDRDTFSGFLYGIQPNARVA